jgi:hypothetical protein
MTPAHSALARRSATGGRMLAALTPLAALSVLSACATYGVAAAEPVPVGDGVYSIAVEPGDGTGAGLHSGAYQRAIRFCFEQGKQLIRLDGQPGTAQQAGTVMQFRCVGPGEPGWKQPVG